MFVYVWRPILDYEMKRSRVCVCTETNLRSSNEKEAEFVYVQRPNLRSCNEKEAEFVYVQRPILDHVMKRVLHLMLCPVQ